MADPLERIRSALTGRYEIVRELGHGGMATVYFARDVQHERDVAIKVLRPELAATLGRDRFLREIRIAAGLQHPHILPLHDSGDADGLLYYVMPYVQGESLRDRLAREGELPIGDAVRILRDVADALAAAHTRGVVHRDIKPDNVLLSGRHALVTDFGVAKAVSDAADAPALTTAGIAVGTPAYMAPEQAAADAQADHRVDIYAFGVLAYELLAGRPPFTGSTARALIAAHLAEPPRPVTAERASVPPALAAVVMKCLEKRPADRWQRANAVGEQLERLLTPADGTPLATRGAAGRSGARRHRGAAVLIGLAVVLTAAGAAVLLRADDSPDLDPLRVVVLPFDDRTGDRALAGLGGLAADWTTREIALSEVVRVVPTATVRELWAADPEQGGRRLDVFAARTGAGTAVTGTVRAAAGRVSLEAEIIDARTGTLTHTLDPLTAPPDSASELVAALAERVTGALATMLNPGAPWLRGMTPAPSLAAFREYDAGLTAFRRERYDEALDHFYRAHGRDSSYATPLVHVSALHWNRGELEEADSALAASAPHVGMLSPIDRMLHGWMAAGLRGDSEAEYRFVEEIVRLIPDRVYELGLTAVHTNRPARAVEIMAPFAEERRDWLYFHDVYAGAYMMLGQPRHALRAVELGRRQHPDALPLIRREIEVRAAMGQVRQVDALLHHATALPGRFDISFATLASAAALEYRAQGHWAAADAALALALEWLAARPPDEGRTADHRFDLARLLYWSGRFEEALPVFEALAREQPAYPTGRAGESPGTILSDRLAFLGATLARLGRRDEAAAVADRLRGLDEPYLRGANTMGRARIAAVLGDSAEAVRLLREAIAQGRYYGDWTRRDPDFESLRGFAPYIDLVRPRG